MYMYENEKFDISFRYKFILLIIYTSKLYKKYLYM